MARGGFVRRFESAGVVLPAIRTRSIPGPAARNGADRVGHVETLNRPTTRSPATGADESDCMASAL